MLRGSLQNMGLRASRVGHARRRHASSAAAVPGHNVKLRTIDELGGPSFLTTLNWLFVKGYFKTTQQMQVRESRGAPACVYLFVCVFIAAAAAAGVGTFGGSSYKDTSECIK